MNIDKELLCKIAELSVKAGAAIMEVYESADFDISYKEGNSPLTRADTDANEVIIEELKRLTPLVPILSEECKEAPYSQRRAWDIFWLVDPLDGTKEFIKKSGEFTVNIALIKDGSPVMGVVHMPTTGTTYTGLVGLGAFKQSSQGKQPKEITTLGYNEGKLKVVASLSHRNKELEDFLGRIEKAQEDNGGVEALSMGSSLKLCLVAEGAAHLYPRIGPTMEWDTGAAHCIVSAAGGRVTDLDGKDLTYNKEDLLNPYFIVAGNPAFDWQKHLKK
ncbi:3'(2'),5'-bisphosphate nucleotidase [hydrothermal vent metagenome]|uniref:3'(2'),5'-bisphosphate nucleotidase n=1 Tax=hydrothermal vent metagenome TaxID=652676 RepID=A0A3B0R503_9ZZZZ